MPRVSALPVTAMENVTRAAVTDPIVVCVTDTAIETVPIVMLANAVFAVVSRFVRHAAVTEKSVMNVITENVLPAVLNRDNRQALEMIPVEAAMLPLLRSRMQTATLVTAAGGVPTAVATTFVITITVIQGGQPAVPVSAAVIAGPAAA